MTEQKTVISKAAWAIKAICVLFVIIAHTDYTAIPDGFGACIISRLGSAGVPMYLVLSGYFFHPRNYESLWILLKKRAVSLCLPWLFCGSVIYLYTVLRSGEGVHLVPAIKFLLGHGSYLYYLSVLLVLQLAFWLLKDLPNKILLWGCMVLSGVSLLLTAAGCLDDLVTWIGLTHYLNAFNWCGFFALGFVVQKRPVSNLIAGIRKISLPAAALWSVLLVCGYFAETRFGYFSWFGYGMELCSCIFLLGLGVALSDVGWLRSLGKYSFPAYLLHIQVIPITAKILGGSVAGVLISPLVTYAITFGFVWLACRSAGWLRCEKLSEYLLGTRV